MKTNVEVLEKQERELTVCDSCGREVDDDGQTCECDFCSVCAPSYTDPQVPENVLTVDEWRSEDTHNDLSMGSDHSVAKTVNVLVGMFSIAGWALLGALEELVIPLVAVAIVLTLIGMIASRNALVALEKKYVQTLEDRGDQR